MKQTLLIFSVLLTIGSYGQSFLNGSFESTTSTGCDYNNGPAAFNDKMDNVIMFSGWEVDIVEVGCYVPSIPDGSKALALAADPLGDVGSDAVNIELSEPLVSGSEYSITFWSFSNTGRPQGDLEIGCTEDSGVMGEIVETVVTVADAWTEHTFTFTAPNNATHISVRNEQDETHWNFIDHFTIEPDCTPLDITASEEELCFDEELVLTAEGLGTITWDMDVENGIEFIPESAGTLIFTATSDHEDDCATSIEITVFELPEVSASVSETTICLGDSIVFGAEGTATEYSWDVEGIVTDEYYTPLVAGTILYTLTGVDDNECEAEDDVMVTALELPVVEGSVDDDKICLGQTVIFSGSGADTYNWSGEVVDGETFEPTETGTFTYAVTGETDFGCVNTAEVSLEVRDAIELDATASDELLGGDGAINLTVTGGYPVYVFDWDNDGTGDDDDLEDLTALAGGTYTVIVEDEEGCSATTTVEVNSQLSVGENELMIQVYPNPTVHGITVAYTGMFNFRLMNTTGAQIITGTAYKNQWIDMENLAAGIYYLHIDNAQPIKVVKQ